MGLFDKIEKTAKRYASQMGYAKKEPAKELSMREMQKRIREQKIEQKKPEKLNEQRHSYLEEEAIQTDTSTDKQVSPAEQKQYERNMLDYFDDDNVTIKFEPVLIADEGIFWAGTIDGQLKFAYMVTPDETTSGVKIERSPTFDPSNPENQEIEKKIIDYYDTFYEYWSKNQLEK